MNAVRRYIVTRITTVTSKGQVTIPKEIRDQLGLKPSDKVMFSFENGHVTLRRAYLALEEVVASIPAIDVPMKEWDDIIQDEAAGRYADKFL
jgi:AbrB family looped-hinge helix DNA binding protein